ncbi:SAM-dependent methyltransferase [Streptomyces abyssalis]|uniref:SAM-dependent methyltransferase n=1 Tax=Streptomyces abyssalis TaxID=933944 RepID=A0A1E7JJQ9_9ACTN|nr:SAM-dependent methyltransferase [Streptomyces abyssalis]OEU87331.1 SAM-dependent methyltransferase [Streptomyces abyssalis]OEU87862.1 SAM-dependent methyltransferase [Streptomyces abyssalis]OEV29881.1 SAM-dependent methyltransferase [Streptomyces nanshensis]
MNTPSAYFEQLYSDSADPWSLDGQWYVQRKYDHTLAALPRRHYRTAFEPGCSVGLLTAALAERCGTLLATDRVAAAAELTAARTRHLPNVRVRQLAIPDEWPEGRFELIVLSELLYYFDDRTLREVLRRTAEALEPGGALVTVHWNHPAPEHHRTGRTLAPVLSAIPGLTLQTDCRDPDFTLHVLERPYGAGPGGRPRG